MKIIIYTLDINGNVPEYVIDGGYFPTLNNNASPQDLDLIGLANDSATQDSFNNEQDLYDYVQSKNIIVIDPVTKQTISLESIISIIWSKLNNGSY